MPPLPCCSLPPRRPSVIRSSTAAPPFRPLTAALSQLLIQSVYLLYRPLSQWVLCLTASALLAAATALLTAHGTTLRQKGLLYAAALSLALVPVTVEGLFSVGKLC